MIGISGGRMSDLFQQVTSSEDIFKKIFSKIPGFSGYIERANRRASDKLLRETIANHFETQWSRLSSIQRDLIRQGDIKTVGDVESAAIKMRQFIDRVRTATYGYSGLFDAVKINEKELAAIYQYDLTMLNLEEQVTKAIDNLETSIGSDGLPAAIRNVVTLTSQCVDTFDRRSEVILAGTTATAQ
jgi:hypothetical protein